MNDNKLSFKRILIADDKFHQVEKLYNFFKEKGIDVLFAKDPEEATDKVEKKNFDLLVLDWYFVLPSESMLALNVIGEMINKKYYIPIFIYSNSDLSIEEICTKIREHTDEVYPEFLINTMEKPTSGQVESVVEKINDWFIKNPTVRLANKWYDAIIKSTGDTLFEIYNRLGKGVITLLNETYKTEEENGSKDLISLITSILSYNILNNNELLEELDNILKKASYRADEQDHENYSALRSVEMYLSLSSNITINTGDIIMLDENMLNEKISCNNCFNIKKTPVYAIDITGECDYARNQKLRYHKFLLGYEVGEMVKRINDSVTKPVNLESFISSLVNYNEDSYHLLPFIREDNDNDFKHIVLDFQNVITIEKTTYDAKIKSKRLCRLRTPYIEHLLRRYSTYCNRIGVPEIPRQQIKDIVNTIKDTINFGCKEIQLKD